MTGFHKRNSSGETEDVLNLAMRAGCVTVLGRKELRL